MAATKRVTSADVARASGVSRTTVSFVLNRTTAHTISEATRTRVLAAARELGYVPSQAGLALARGRTDIVILDLGRVPIGEYQLGRFAQTFTTELERAGMTAIIHGPDDSDGATLVGLARVVQPFAVVSFANLSRNEAALRAAGVQLIQGIDFEAVRIDSDWMSDAAELQLTHLRERGHQALAYAHPAAPALRELSERKREVTSARAQQLGMTLTSEVAVGQDRSDTARRVKRWRSEHPQVSAVVCFNDDVGLAILAALSDNAIAVPREIAVIGTDDAPSAQYSIPAMTTLRSDVTAGAAQLARAVVCALNGQDPPLIPPHTFTIVERDST